MGEEACVAVALKTSESQQTRGGNADFALGGGLSKASGCRNDAVSVSIPSILKFNQTNGNNKVEHRPSLDLSRLTMSNHGREILNNPNEQSAGVSSSAEAFSCNTCGRVSPRKRC